MAEIRIHIRPHSLRGAICVAAASLFAAFLVVASPANANQRITHFETTSSSNLSGSHPDLSTSLELEDEGSPEAAQDVAFEAPQGLFGNVNAITKCVSNDFALDQCPPDSQVGVITIWARDKGPAKDLLGTAPIYNLVPQADQTALFAFVAPTLNIPIQMPVTVRTGSDFGLTFTIADITQLAPLAAANVTFWGLPTEPEHAVQRFPKGAPGEPAGCPGIEDTGCLTEEVVANLPPRALTDYPVNCTGRELITSLRVITYEHPEQPLVAHSSYPPVTECYRDNFKPLLASAPTTSQSDSPSGLDLDLRAQQFLGFPAAPSPIQSSVVTFPPGFTINPDAADGQTACTEAQANFGSQGRAACPDNAKIGTVSIGSPSLESRLIGSLYIGEPKPGNQYRLFLIASGSGMNVKLVGSFRPDPQTGQLSAYFENLPQAPFEDFQLHLFSGERALMATPTQCTIYTVDAEFVPWDEVLAPVRSSQIFSTNEGPHGALCPGQVRPFEPSLVAGTSNPVAGGFSSFTLKLDREDGDQYLGKLNFTMPPGLSANLHGITYCPEGSIIGAAQKAGRAEQANPSCPPSSQIGTTNVAAGPGIHPFHAIGKLYLAGPFQGAPLSLVAITPALAGPYDYGTVVIRVAIHLDPLDAHVIADSETVPEIIGGIPIRMREIRVSIDRPNFMINPTNCSPFTAGSEGIGDQGTVAAFTSRFQVVNCATLPFQPKMSVTETGKKGTARGQDPAVRFDLRTRSGDANLRSISVTLPNAFEIDQRHLGNICARSELQTTHCAGRAPIGTVKDETPLLERPLAGNAYAVSGYGGLPHVAFLLGGQVMVVPQGETETVTGGRLQTTVPVVPDVPIGHFQLSLFGGKRGYLANTRSLCAGHPTIGVAYHAQNGKQASQVVAIKTACATAKHHKRHKRDRRKAGGQR